MSGPINCVDPEVVGWALRPLSYEMGLRDTKLDSGSLVGKIGIGRNTCVLVVSLNSIDTYDFTIETRRRRSGAINRHVLKTGRDIDIERLSGVIIDAWIDLCDERCW